MSAARRRKPKSRGFRTYGALRTAHGSSIAVYSCSAPGERSAWLDARVVDTEEGACVRLSAEQARELAKALLEFAEEGS